MFADIVLAVPLEGTFTYTVPPRLQARAAWGRRAVVPFGTRKTQAGIIVRLHDEKPEGFATKDILDIPDEPPVVNQAQWKLWQWIADYYIAPIGEVYKAALPADVKAAKTPKRPRREAPVPTLALPAGPAGFPERPELSPAQLAAKAAIEAQWAAKPVVLLQGVTGSGKTEIYIRLICEQIARGRQTLYLLPEIALTVQIMDRLSRVFGPRLAIYHSRYSAAERAAIWRRQLSANPYDIVLGARSAVLLPFQKLGLVVVDEEHESSYKQQEPAPRYHARSAAIVLAHITGAKVLLGTATPSIESWHAAETGKFGLARLEERYSGVQLPAVEIIDTQDLRHRRMMTGMFSPQLLAALRRTLDAGEQAMLFQNRRGFAPVVECKQCGWVPHCPNCDVPMTLHAATGNLTCHYCGATVPIPQQCPACEGTQMFTKGYGTEKIEQKLHDIYPEARIARMDLDSTRSRAAYGQIIDDFAKGRTDILIGTQMISKGLDFERVGLVGIVDADQMMNMPDFRAWERAYQMMTQVSGRAGRRGRQGLVMIQTRQPQTPLLAYVAAGDYESLYAATVEERRQFGYPPFARLAYAYLRHKDEPTADNAAKMLAAMLRQWFGARILGPDAPGIARQKGVYIRRVMIKLENGIDLPLARQYMRHARSLMAQDKRVASVGIYFDIDPE